MNKYLKNLRRIEFIITNDCTGKCKHCSQGEHRKSGIHIDKEAACRVICDTIKEYDIRSVMTFGGEPLIHYDITCAILSAATDAKIPHRQLITNGFFSNNEEKIKFVANQLGKSGVNDILLSVDAFHQETIPLFPVKLFAFEIKKLGLNIKTSPAWLVNKGHDNEYNRKTADILNEFEKMGIPEGEGNVVFRGGNADKYLSEYFDDGKEYINPYEEDPNDLRSFSVEADGSVFGKSIYTRSILEILREYQP